MKKFALALIASFAFVQSGQAALSNLSNSLNEIQTIIDSPLISTAIAQSEFIVDTKRLTKSLTAANITYEIKTFVGQVNSGQNSHYAHHKKYIVSLVSSVNPSIGPNLLTVINVRPVSNHSVEIFGQSES